jgi:prepilin-type N-terminal cleavage/methylation domain-containing protein
MNACAPEAVAAHYAPPSARDGTIAFGRQRESHAGARGFTLFEIMMVLAILVLIVGIGFPAMVSTVRKGPMRQAVSDLEEGFLKARMLAILTGQPAELLIGAADGSLEVRAVTESPAEPVGTGLAMAEESAVPPEVEGAAGESSAPRPEALPRFSAKLHDSVAFKQLVVSLRDMMDETQAAVRFYPNGTSDALAMRIVSDAGEERAIALEITTGRPRIDVIR